MAELTSQTTFTIQAAPEILEESVDLILLPENAGVWAMRELHYPDDLLPPLVYQENPDRWINFDSEPLTARPAFKAEMTLKDTALASWAGYLKDQPVKEYWAGSDTTSRMPADFFRRLWEYFINSPTTSYITWWPKDRTTKGYNIVIESLQAGGDNMTLLHTAALKEGFIMGEVVFTFRIIGEAD
jgi:hypothetical protein